VAEAQLAEVADLRQPAAEGRRLPEAPVEVGERFADRRTARHPAREGVDAGLPHGLELLESVLGDAVGHGP
jgi:hypothetical protein